MSTKKFTTTKIAAISSVARLHDRVVALEDRVQELVADAGQPEDDLGDRGAADQRADLEAGHRDDRDRARSAAHA